LPTPVSALIHAAYKSPYLGVFLYTLPITSLLLSTTLGGIVICPAIPFLGATAVTLLYYIALVLLAVLSVTFTIAVIYVVWKSNYTVVHHFFYVGTLLLLVVFFILSFLNFVFGLIIAF